MVVLSSLWTLRVTGLRMTGRMLDWSGGKTMRLWILSGGEGEASSEVLRDDAGACRWAVA